MKRLLIIAGLLVNFSVVAQTPQGEMKGQALVHTSESARLVVANGALVLPSSVTGAGVYAGLLKNAPLQLVGKAPVVLFMHGSSGLGLKAIGEWQLWLASLGIASFAPDSFALPDRLTYKSPISKDVYEKIHALRLSEVELAAQALKANKQATIVLIPGTPHTLINLPAARHATAGFLRDVFKL